MRKLTDSSYLKFLSELEDFERRQKEVTVEEIEDWKQRVTTSLQSGYSLRFSRLKFYERTEESVFNDDLPF